MPAIPKLTYSLYRTNKNLVILLTLLCCALLIDVSVGKWIIMPPGVMLIFILACLLYIDYFTYWWAAILTLAIFFLIVGRSFPRLANHGNLEIFLCLAIFFLYLRRIITGKGVSTDTLTRCFRYSLVTIYFIAGFHKLNTGFFSISGSCSTYVTQGLNVVLFEKHIIYPEIVVRLLQIGTIIIEIIVPIGILFHQTRKVTAYILVIFHFYLSFCGFSNFSAFAAFLLAGCLLNLNQLPDYKFVRVIKFYIFITIIASLATYLFRKFNIGSRQASLMVNGVVYNIGYVYLFYYLLKKKVTIHRFKASVLPYVLVILILMWGVQGYLGLSNTSTLTMFSNLVTEKGRNNHFIIDTEFTKIWDYEEDYVTILKLPEQEPGWEEKYKIKDYDLPLIEFKKVAKHWVQSNEGKLSCTILYRGKIIHIDDLGRSGFSKTKWWYRFLYYRRIPKQNINQCMW